MRRSSWSCARRAPRRLATAAWRPALGRGRGAPQNHRTAETRLPLRAFSASTNAIVASTAAVCERSGWQRLDDGERVHDDAACIRQPANSASAPNRTRAISMGVSPGGVSEEALSDAGEGVHDDAGRRAIG